jgi:hypothetical protein
MRRVCVRHRCDVMFILLMSIQHIIVFAYFDDEIKVTTAGFHVGKIQHEVATNQIVIQLTLSGSMNTIPILYISQEDWSLKSPRSDKVHTHPCENGVISKNNICCINSLILQYQVAPSMQNMYDNSNICPIDNDTGIGQQNYTVTSTENAHLSVHTIEKEMGLFDFLSTGFEDIPYNETVERWTSIWHNSTVNCTDNNDTYSNKTECYESILANVSTHENITKYNKQLTYPTGVSYELLSIQDTTFRIELRLNHEYLKTRSRKTPLGSSPSGVVKYESYIGVTFVTLQPYSSGVSISTAQVAFEYFKSDHVFMSIAIKEENPLPSSFHVKRD